MQELTKNTDQATKQIAAQKMLFLISHKVEGVGKAAFNIIEMMGQSTEI